METLEAYGWQKNPSVEQGLYSEGHRFDFYQAVKLLELLFPELEVPGVGSDPSREAVRFRSTVDLAFAATDLDSVEPPTADGAPASMAVNFMGLAGGQGPLPSSFTELIRERAWRKDSRGERDTAFRDFLDIFNHRLVALLYRARKKYRPALTTSGPDESRISRPFFALLGLGTAGVRGRLGVDERALLGYSGLLARQARTMVGLEGMLEDYFDVAVDLRPFRARRFDIAEDQITRLGRSGQNQRLGLETVLGSRVWDQEAAYELHLGPISLERFLDFLPTGTAFVPLVSLARFYTGHELDASVRLTLSAAEVPQLWLGGPARLGWTSWLETLPFVEDDSQVVLDLSLSQPESSNR